MKRFIFVLSAMLFLLLPLSGCTYKSGPTSLDSGEKDKSVSNPQARAIIEKAVNKTDREGKKFWYNGWVVNKIQKRRTTSMYNGTFVRDLGYLVEARVLGQDYKYYRYKQDAYISEGENWVKAKPSEKPLDPFSGFKVIVPYADQARQLPDQEILDRDCYVFEINLDGSDVKRVFKELGLAADDELENLLLEQLEMKYRLWIGKEDSYIYQLKTEALMPTPEAGSMYQEVYFRFWDYNSESVTLTKPEQIIKYLKEEK